MESSESPHKSISKKKKKDKKFERSPLDSSRSRSGRYSPNDHSQKRKHYKDREKKKNRSRSRSRDKKKKHKGKSNRPKEDIRTQRDPYPRDTNKSDLISIPTPKTGITEEERQKKIAMRQVKIGLLKLNEIFGEEEDSDEKQPTVEIRKTAEAALVQTMPMKRTGAKKQSKWGKTSNVNDTSIISGEFIEEPKQNLEIKEKGKASLSLDIEPSQEKLGLSEDRSIDQEDQHGLTDPLEQIQEEEIDPLEEYMKEIDREAIPQVELPKSGNKGKVISFEDIVTQPQSVEISYQQKQDEIFKEQFIKAIHNIDEVKNVQSNRRGTLMDNNDKESDSSDFQEQVEEELDFFAKQRKLAERKELKQVDHSQIKYEEVTFNLYREAEEVRRLDPKQVQRYRKEAGDIKIRGKSLLNPIFNWYFCGFSEAVLSVIEKNKYDKPFPIQAQSIPMILSGRDVIGIAETGSGKTLAYLLPMIKHVASQKPVGEGDGPIGIIMTPTRQLAHQVYTEAKKFCKSSRIRVLAVYGGLPVDKQLNDFRKGTEIVICTPGRMIDILTLNKGKITNLRRVTMIVIDEADRMFDLGFQPQITRIFDNVRPHRQTVMFSATFPKNVENLVKRILTNPVEILVGSRGQACRNVEQIIEVREEQTKFLRLLEILGQWNEKGSILIFVDKQSEGDFLFQELGKYGYHCLLLHGAMDPTDRQFTIYDFKKGIKTIMVSTSVSARGLDIKEIVLVVNFKCPNHLEDYIHRIGRTGRAGNKGTSITFITPKQEQYSIDLIKALEMSDIHPPEDLIKLSQEFLKKVKKGQAKKIRNRNIQGAGFKFDKEEEQKTSQFKDMLKKQLKNQGLGGFEDSDDDDIEAKKKKEEELRGRNQQERVVEAIRNPEIKNKLLNEAVKAVSEAMKDNTGLTTQKLLEIAVSSMKDSVTKHKVIATVDDGVEQVTKLISQFTNKGNGQGIDNFSYDFQINDYPPASRNRACSQHFLGQVQRDNNCTISLRGVYVEPGKKAPVGCRKLYLHIQSEDKSYVSNAYKDIKRVIEESAYENVHMGSVGKYMI